MEEKIRDAVFGNVGTTVTFRVGPFDAEVLEPVFEPQFLATDLVNLGAYQIYLTLMIDGAGSAPFSATTLSPVKTPEKSHKFMVIKRSQQNYTRPRSEVEKIVNDLHTPEDRIADSAKGEGANSGAFTKPSGFFKVDTDKKFAAQKASIKAGDGNRPPKPERRANNSNAIGSGARTGQSTDKPDRRMERPARKPDSARQVQKSVSPDRPHDGSTQRTKPPEKSPDDLRAILAQLAHKPANEKKSNAAEPKKSEEKKITVGGDTHRADLKNALAGVLAQTNAVESPKAPVQKTPEKPLEESDSAVVARSIFTPRSVQAAKTIEQPDLQIVKKMLRHSGSERLPGMK